jgi:hypothetical protein
MPREPPFRAPETDPLGSVTRLRGETGKGPATRGTQGRASGPARTQVDRAMANQDQGPPTSDPRRHPLHHLLDRPGHADTCQADASPSVASDASPRIRRLQGPARGGQIARFAYAGFALGAAGPWSRERRSCRSRCRPSTRAVRKATSGESNRAVRPASLLSAGTSRLGATCPVAALGKPAVPARGGASRSLHAFAQASRARYARRKRRRPSVQRACHGRSIGPGRPFLSAPQASVYSCQTGWSHYLKQKSGIGGRNGDIAEVMLMHKRLGP